MLKSPRYNDYKYSSTPDLKAHAAVTRQAATDGMVLLKNADQALPIMVGVKNIAAFGNTSYDFIAGGTGRGDVNEAYTISLFEGLTNGGYTPDAKLTNTYNSYVKDAKAKQGKPKNPIAAMLGAKEPVDVKNAGLVAGREIVQLYVGSPSGKLKKPAETLAAFTKTKLLKPGETQTISFIIETKDFASFNEATSSWIAEAGTYNLEIGASSRAIKQTGTFKIAKELEAGKVTRALAPTREINKLVSK